MNADYQRRKITYKPSFLESVLAIEAYVGRTNAQRGRKLTVDLFDFIISVVEPNPFAFPEYMGKPTPTHSYRRAVFRKKYALYYRVTEDALIFLQFYHTRQNPGSIRLEE